VLVVEDDRALREMSAALTVAGHTVAAVEDGIDALRYIEKAAPNLIVLDLALPRLGGHDVQRELASRAETRDIPIVVVTGTDTRNLKPTDFDCILAKPVSAEALVVAVDRCLRSIRRPRPAVDVGHGRSLAPSDPEVINPLPLTEGRSSQVRHQARTVLVVDDEVAVQKLLRHFLEEKGYRVKTASSVGEAISVLERGIIDAVVLDVRMPRRSGLELLEFMRLDERLRDVPVLILTGVVLTPDEETILARHRPYVFYKSENLESLAVQLDQLTG
jgi:CheY-like chemotaxis protein